MKKKKPINIKPINCIVILINEIKTRKNKNRMEYICEINNY